MTNKLTIAKEEFEAYESVRKSGVTNMFDVGVVARLSGLSREQIFEISRRYGELTEKYKKGGNQ
ncbi:hypothetical protein ES707_07389 [subsurface metagenome]